MSQPVAVVTTPARRSELRRRVEQVERQLFLRVQMPSSTDREVLASALLVADATLLFSGSPGSGKTTAARVIGETYFCGDDGSPDMAVVNCHQNLNEFDTLYHMDLAALQQGREVVHPKPVVRARLKFLNEIQRAPTVLHIALLPLLSEHEVNYRGARFASPSFVAILDRNPADGASQTLSPAFLDRIDFGLVMAAPHLCEALSIGAARRRSGGRWRPLTEGVDERLTVHELEEVWRDVPEVSIPVHVELFGIMLLEAFRLCVREERSTLHPAFDLDCSSCGFRGEICSHLETVPGHRAFDSLMRLAQAAAWRHGRQSVAVHDLVTLLPAVLGHRLRLRPDVLRSAPTEVAWVRDVAVGKILKSKERVWRKAASALLRGEREGLAEIGQADLVVRELVRHFDDPVILDLRQRYWRQARRGHRS